MFAGLITLPIMLANVTVISLLIYDL